MRGNNVIFVFWVWTISLCMITFSFSYFPTNDIISFMLCAYGLQLLLFSGLLVYLRKSFPMLISWGVFPLFSCSRRWVWWCIPKMIFFRKQRQENCYKFKASLTYIVSSGWSGIDSERQYQWNKTKKMKQKSETVFHQESQWQHMLSGVWGKVNTYLFPAGGFTNLYSHYGNWFGCSSKILK